MATKPNTQRPNEAAEYLGVPVETLAQWRYRRQGPAYVKLGRRVVYRTADLDAWMDANTVRPDA